jgi:hypothetical protein
MDRDGAHAQRLRGANDPAGNLTAIGNENGFEQGFISSESNLDAKGLSAQVEIAFPPGAAK